MIIGIESLIPNVSDHHDIPNVWLDLKAPNPQLECDNDNKDNIRECGIVNTNENSVSVAHIDDVDVEGGAEDVRMHTMCCGA